MTDSEDHVTVAKVTSLDTPSTLNSSKEKSRGFFLTRRGDRRRKQTNLRKLVVGCLAPPQSSPAGAENGGGRAPLPRRPRVPGADRRAAPRGPLAAGGGGEAPNLRPLSRFKDRRKTAFSHRFAFISTFSLLRELPQPEWRGPHAAVPRAHRGSSGALLARRCPGHSPRRPTHTGQ